MPRGPEENQKTPMDTSVNPSGPNAGHWINETSPKEGGFVGNRDFQQGYYKYREGERKFEREYSPKLWKYLIGTILTPDHHP